MADGFFDVLKECDADIRSGNIVKAKTRLARIPKAKIPRDLKHQFARLCRRTGQINLGLKILTPLVLSENVSPATSANELAEYALLLQRAGGVREALDLLSKIDPGAAPEVWLYRSLCHFNLWEYEPTIGMLENYLRQSLSPAEALIGKVNYASALVSTERWEPAEEQIHWNIEEALRCGNVRLRANSLEMLAQVQIGRGDWAKARREIEHAHELLKNSTAMDELFVRKWRALVKSHDSGDAGPLLKIRAEALVRGHFETVRDADLLALTIDFSKPRFDHLYFGSPLPAYRARIRRKLGRDPADDHYILGTMDGAPLAIGETGKVDQFLSLMTSDFYRPYRLAEIFADLFPGEHFNIFSSPSRVQQIIRRARRRIENENLPLTLDTVGGGLKLKVHGPVAIHVPLARRVTKDRIDQQVDQLVRIGKSKFTAAEGRQAMQVSATGFRRIIDRAIERGVLESFRAGPAVFYFMKESA